MNALHRKLINDHKFCQWCKTPISPWSPSETKYKTRWNMSTVDHIISRSKNGSNQKENIKISCLKCNNGREMFGDCIGAYFCALAISGPNSNLRQIQDKIGISGKSKKRLIKKNFPMVRSYSFFYISPYRRLHIENKPVAIFRLRRDTKILYEGTEDYNKYNENFERRISKNSETYRSLINGGYHGVWKIKRGLIVIDETGFDVDVIFSE